MQVILAHIHVLHAHITSIKTSVHYIVIVIVSNSISRKMSVSHDIIMIEHNPKLPIRVLFCCFLCTVCSIVSDYLMLAIRVLCSFRRTVFSMVSDSLIRFIVFPHKFIHSTFHLDWKMCEQRSHVLTGTAASHCGHTF